MWYELRTNVCRWSWHSDKDGANRRWKTYPYRSNIWRLRGGFQQRQGEDTPAASVNGPCKSTCNPAAIYHMGRSQLSGVFSWVELSRAVFIQLRGWRSRAQELENGCGFELKDLMPYGQIDEWVLSSDGQHLTGWIMGLRWTVNGRWTIWRLVNMTFWELTKLQEKSRNEAHTSAIMHSGNQWLEPTGSQPQMDRSQR